MRGERQGRDDRAVRTPHVHFLSVSVAGRYFLPYTAALILAGDHSVLLCVCVCVCVCVCLQYVCTNLCGFFVQFFCVCSVCVSQSVCGKYTRTWVCLTECVCVRMCECAFNAAV